MENDELLYDSLIFDDIYSEEEENSIEDCMDALGLHVDGAAQEALIYMGISK